MRWVNSQLARILGWVERAIQQEVKVQELEVYPFLCIHFLWFSSGKALATCCCCCFFFSQKLLYLYNLDL